MLNLTQAVSFQILSYIKPIYRLTAAIV